MTPEKIKFLKNDFIPLLKDLPTEAKGKWGKMNGQQMVEHVTGFFKVSIGKIQIPLVTPIDKLPKLKEFLQSEKEFLPNTKAPDGILPDEPLPVRKASMQEAVNDLQKTINDFFSYYEQNEDHKKTHPVFGDLSFLEWVQLHHKHVIHHLKQFGLLG
ncbi:MAG: DUF1569 domain-containing protein [Chitinophagaceae bacterium]|nr:MAG: DUF1569 domain-containing protein [Chitinophagaceae bacterium]